MHFSVYDFLLAISPLVPQGGSHSFKSQKSKVLWNKLFSAFQWSAYLRRAVLVGHLE